MIRTVLSFGGSPGTWTKNGGNKNVKGMSALSATRVKSIALSLSLWGEREKKASELQGFKLEPLWNGLYKNRKVRWEELAWGARSGNGEGEGRVTLHLNSSKSRWRCYCCTGERCWLENQSWESAAEKLCWASGEATILKGQSGERWKDQASGVTSVFVGTRSTHCTEGRCSTPIISK